MMLKFFKYLKWNFFEYLHFWFQCKFQSSKYELKGHCRQCGECCRNIVFIIGDKYVTTEEEFESLKNYKKIYNHFYISGRHADGALVFTCKSLTDENKCRDYKFRSIYCRNYPKIIPSFISNGGTLQDNCGYRIVLKKKFREFME